MKKHATSTPRLISLVLAMIFVLSLFAANTNEVIYKVRQLREFLLYRPVSDGQTVTPFDSLAVTTRKKEIREEIDALLASTREDYETREITILGYLQDKGVLSLNNNDLNTHMNIRMTPEQADIVTRNPGNFYLTAKRELDQNLNWTYYNWVLKGYQESYYEDEEEINDIPKVEPVEINPEALIEITEYLYAKDPEGKTAIDKFRRGDYQSSLGDLLLVSQSTRTQRPTYYFWIGMNYMNLGDMTNARYYFEKYLQTYDTSYAGAARHYLDLIESQQTVFSHAWVNTYPAYLSSDSGESHFTVSPDGNYLYFSSLRPGSLKGANIWRAERLNSMWGYPETVNILNTNDDEALCSFSIDGNRAYLMGTYTKDKPDYDLYYSDRALDWTTPVNLSAINSEAEDIDPYVYQDKLMFFSSSRPGGYGGYDIYMSVFREGSWQAPVNLGSSVNSAGDEFSPFMDWDGKTLFFSSNGYPGFGGYDIYKVVVLNAEGSAWSRAENVGAPINSAFNESRFYHLKNSNEGILLSDRSKSGIYTMRPLNLEYAPRSYYTVDNAGNILYVKDTDATSPLSGLLASPEQERKYLEIYGNITNEKQEPVITELSFTYYRDQVRYTERVRPDNTGFYTIQIPVSHRYVIEASPAGYSRFTLDLLPRIDQTKVRQDIGLSPLDLDKVFVFSNIQFDYDSAVLQAGSYPVLNEIALTLLNNPGIRVEISGHTCENQGGEKYNNTLSRKRADAVVAYLESKGVNGNRMVSKGYGMSRPLNDNQSEEDKTLNRRVEVRIIK